MPTLEEMKAFLRQKRGLSQPSQTPTTFGGEPQQFGGSQMFGGGRYKITPKIEGFDIKDVGGDLEEKRQEELMKQDVKKRPVEERIKNLEIISDKIPRGSGMLAGVIPNRWIEGAKTSIEQIGQGTPRGIAGTQLNNITNDILAPLVKLSGDTGNIAQWEQKIRKGLVESKWDSEEMKGMKRAYMRELVRMKNDPATTPNQIQQFFDDLDVSGGQ